MLLGTFRFRISCIKQQTDLYICFAVSFCILTFPLGGFIRKMNFSLGDILLIFILYSFWES